MSCKYELHVHTSQGSACGWSTGAEMADYFKRLGYAGMVVTDHFDGGNTAIDFNQPWVNAVESFCLGYEDAKRRGDEIELDVFFGFEYSFHGTEFLIYGLDKEWLINNPQIIKMSLKNALKYFRKAGAFIIHAHPFREAPYIEMFRLLPDYTDAVEVYNVHNTDRHNERAGVYAMMFGLKEVGGGDVHGADGQASGIDSPKRLHTIGEMINLIRHCDYKIIKPKIYSSYFTK
ncbi:MAG: PHP domain-containing protein [Oscillospiraceae bacterium]|jgi:predicted metal-dependent phosphoesterase TrpH|nr:PHP domain-containing protein [Oscillospiraceae bacterium]